MGTNHSSAYEKNLYFRPHLLYDFMIDSYYSTADLTIVVVRNETRNFELCQNALAHYCTYLPLDQHIPYEGFHLNVLLILHFDAKLIDTKTIFS